MNTKLPPAVIFAIFLLLKPDFCCAGEVLKMNDQWKYYRGEAPGAELRDFPDSQWESATLPHTAKTESLNMGGADVPINEQWLGICWYRKSFKAPAGSQDKKIYLKFEGAMMSSRVWLNGELLGEHLGGYQPFVYDITDKIQQGATNTIAVRLNNLHHPTLGPRRLDGCDLELYHGLYRGATLIIKDKLHITDPIYANKPAGGGVFVTYPEVSKDLAKVLVKVHVLNEDATALRQEMRADLVDRQGKIVASVEVPTMTIDAGIEQEHVLTLNVAAPHLWSPDSPYLYTLRATLLAAGTTIETEELKIGIRSIRCSTDGFFLNGEKVVLNGVNRHQDYPYIGYALSPEAQYRDAFKIKEAGFNFVRLSHYPQDPGFLSAMDELGLMAMAPVLGWQYSQNTLEFNEQKYQEFRELIRRDRNHPCVVLWEPGLKSPV